MVKSKKLKMLFDCSRCAGYCCTYEVIGVTEQDITRLAKHFHIPPATFKEKYTHLEGKERTLNKRPDKVYRDGTCLLFDTEKRRCTVYEARPQVCRQYPTTNYCPYYDMLQLERRGPSDRRLTLVMIEVEDKDLPKAWQPKYKED